MTIAQRAQFIASLSPATINWHTKGKVIYTYHRTPNTENIFSIHYDKFKPQNSTLYGPGFYSTYSFASQFYPRMALTYGDFILKVKINLKNYLVLDSHMQQLTNKPDIIKQLQSKLSKADLKLHGLSEYDILRLGPIKIRNTNSINDKYTSTLALKISKIPDIQKKFAGILFTGKNDGDVLVGWNLTTIKPVAFAEAGRNKSERTINWHNLVAVIKRKIQPLELMQTWAKLPLKSAIIQAGKTLNDLNRYEMRYFWYMLGHNAKTISKLPLTQWFVSRESDAWFGDYVGQHLGELRPFKDFLFEQKLSRHRYPRILNQGLFSYNQILFCRNIHDKIIRSNITEWWPQWQADCQKFITNFRFDKQFSQLPKFTMVLQQTINYLYGLHRFDRRFDKFVNQLRKLVINKFAKVGIPSHHIEDIFNSDDNDED